MCRCSLGPIDGPAYPCAMCGAVGQDVWVGVQDGLCPGCRKGSEGTMTQELTIYEEKLPDMRPEQAEARGLTAWFEQWTGPEMQLLEINTQEEKEVFTDVLKEIKTNFKKLEDAEKSVTGPINQSLQIFRSWFAPGKAAAKKAEELIKKKILESDQRRRMVASEAAKKVELALAAGDTKTAIVQHARIQPVEKIAGLQTRKTWQATVINKDIVPPEYLVVDMQKVKAEMRAQLEMHPGETPVISGIKFEQIEGLAVT